MIAQNFEYSAPNTLPEALQLLADGTAKVLAVPSPAEPAAAQDFRRKRDSAG